jgi:hypothetical protein
MTLNKTHMCRIDHQTHRLWIQLWYSDLVDDYTAKYAAGTAEVGWLLF